LRLAEVLVVQGDIVKAGQLLARLDDAELRQRVALAAKLIIYSPHLKSAAYDAIKCVK
jgi:multidrug efflux pump subunit AcrA (membrane-fusion protein)